MSGLEAEAIAALAAVALFAGMVDAIAGGGGLITVPALLIAGLDPVQAIATNKLQGTFGTASATYAFARRGLIDWRSAWAFALVACAASILGALGVRLLPRPVLEAVIPVLLVSIALFFALAGLRPGGGRPLRAVLPRGGDSQPARIRPGRRRTLARDRTGRNRLPAPGAPDTGASLKSS